MCGCQAIGDRQWAGPILRQLFRRLFLRPGPGRGGASAPTSEPAARDSLCERDAAWVCVRYAALRGYMLRPASVSRVPRHGETAIQPNCLSQYCASAGRRAAQGRAGPPRLAAARPTQKRDFGGDYASHAHFEEVVAERIVSRMCCAHLGSVFCRADSDSTTLPVGALPASARPALGQSLWP